MNRAAILCCVLLLWATACGSSGGNTNANVDANVDANIDANVDANVNANTNQNTNANQNTNTATLALVHRVGRFDDGEPTAPRFTWPGSSFLTRLNGTALEVDLDGAGGVYFQVIVDGVMTSVFQTTSGPGRYAVASGLSDGPHDVEIYRRNEGFFGVVRFVGFVPGSGAALVESARPYQHRLEFIGDSTTCGYGVEGPNEFCSFTGDTESSYTAYAAVAARELGAEAHLIAYSGKGVYQNYGGDLIDPMPALYDRTLTEDESSTWDFTQWTPEVVVVNLGSNDFSAAITQAQFVDAYAALLDQIRLQYPLAHIFCIAWADWGALHESWVSAAATQTGDTNTTTISFATDFADGYGCDYHPSAVSHQKFGQQLATAIRAELGW